MKILFCNIANMKHYRGITEKDTPKNGGKYVTETGKAGEEYNFHPFMCDGEEVCLGYVETNSSNGKSRNKLHVENIASSAKNAAFIEDVLVVWCAFHDCDERTVAVGWYKNATVYRDVQNRVVTLANGEQYNHEYNVMAKKEDCVLLPAEKRHANKWTMPRKKKNKAYGFGQSNLWYAPEERAEDFINSVVHETTSYTDENSIDA